jgi:hypothetical protein
MQLTCQPGKQRFPRQKTCFPAPYAGADAQRLRWTAQSLHDLGGWEGEGGVVRGYPIQQAAFGDKATMVNDLTSNYKNRCGLPVQGRSSLENCAATVAHGGIKSRRRIAIRRYTCAPWRLSAESC